MTTGRCNLNCKYCGGSFPEESVPFKIKYDLERIKNLIKRDSDPTVIFYGGEPLMNLKFIMEFMDEIGDIRFGIQTNGVLTKMLPEDYWRKMDLVLLSIDGREHITDSMRGKGIYKKVVESANYLKNLGIETIARMTVTERSDIYEEVTHLLNLKLFDKIHWQLNVVWTERWNFKKWSEDSYLPGLEKLLDLFMSSMRKGEILKIIPFLGIVSSYYYPRHGGVVCGAGYSSITISTDGRILSCPIAVSEEWAQIGSIEKGFNIEYDDYPDECKNCEFLSYCGGRCLYANKERFWGNEGWYEVDSVTRAYISKVLSRIPEIDDLIKSKIIDMRQLKYDPTKDSTEVIP